MSRSSLFVAVVMPFALLSLHAPVALAGKPRTHDRFFLRMAVGGGWFGNRLEGVGGKADFSGFAGDGDIAVGGMVSPNLALHGTIFGWAATNPDLEFTPGGPTFIPAPPVAANGSVTLSAFGGGLTYYFMPANAYLSGSLGFGTLGFDPDGGPHTESGDGIALELTAGKEWWAGNSWGLGIAGAYMFSSMPQKGLSDNWMGNSFSLRFSATFN
jgi:hypothetical protein